MHRFLMLSALSALVLSACKPTPRTALSKPQPLRVEEVATPTEPPAPPVESPAPAESASDIAASLLTISSTRQDYNRLRPWEKNNSSSSNFVGAYMGNGRVLTVGSAAQAATYLEICLPDDSRRVPARVLRYDRDLNLALLVPVHEEDNSIFDGRKALEAGAPLHPGDEAALDTLVRGTFPVRTPLLAESGEVADVHTLPQLTMPRIALRSATPLPEGPLGGIPVLRDGKLVGISTGGNREGQVLHCINAELISRFLAGEDGEYASCPLIGIETADMDDPVFRAYLQLERTQGGLYVNDVSPGSSAERAGLRAGDVITAVDGLSIDTQGRCQHPLYGAISARAAMSSLKPVGDTLNLSISRNGSQQQLELPLRRLELEGGLPGTLDAPGVQPRYILWGGLLFQPLTQDLFAELGRRLKNAVPVSLIEVSSRGREYMGNGVTELVALTQIIPTPATLSYESAGLSLVEKVNGKPVRDFAEFARLLDEPTEDGIVELSLNKAPYTLYIDRRIAEAADSALRRGGILQLRWLGE